MNEEQIAREMLQKKVWAVVGANDNPDKYGNKIYKRLKEHEYEVYPVNPVRDIVEGDKCYKDLASMPKVPDVLEMVVPPKRGMEYLKEAQKLGVKYVWLQPDTYDDEMIQYLEDNNFIYLKACVLVLLSYKEQEMGY